MTEAMPFLRKLILLSYDPRPFTAGDFFNPVDFRHVVLRFKYFYGLQGYTASQRIAHESGAMH